jgi:hypothetical protein
MSWIATILERKRGPDGENAGKCELLLSYRWAELLRERDVEMLSR